VTLLAACSDDGETADEAPDTTTSITSTTTPTFTGEADSPFCNLLRDLDVAAVLGDTEEDPAAVGAAFQQIVDVLVDAAELAPEEITADVALVAEGMSSLDAALAAVGYDFDALAASGDAEDVLAAVNDPAFAEAGTRLSAYRTQVCGL
jgi:hypothetical protein